MQVKLPGCVGRGVGARIGFPMGRISGSLPSRTEQRSWNYSAASGRCFQWQAKPLPHIDQGFAESVDQPVVVIGRGRNAQPLSALRHGRVVDRLNVYIVLREKEIARRLTFFGVADHHRHNVRRRCHHRQAGRGEHGLDPRSALLMAFTLPA